MLRVCSRTIRGGSKRFELLFCGESKWSERPRLVSTAAGTRAKRPSLLLGILAGVGLGTGFAYYRSNSGPRPAVLNSLEPAKCVVLDSLPPSVQISRKVRYAENNSGLEFVLFQYPTCPFCCKVRAFLDWHGFSYDVVEVNPVMRQQLSWTSYRKVPILLVKTPDNKYLQLNDSSMIISALESYLLDRKTELEKVAGFYPTTSFSDDSGNLKTEIINRYFLMYQGAIPRGETKESIEDLRKWRRWADDVLVHTLSPNVYRTTSEALDSFNWFSQVGDWERLFAPWERLLVVNVGAYAMWIIGKRLKKRHNLKDDVRESLYDACKQWTRELKKKGSKFHGGSEPDLADLAVYGVLSSIEGCQAFADLTSNTNITSWYKAVKASLTSHHRLS